MNDGGNRIDELRSLLPRCMLADWVRLGSRLARMLKDHWHPQTHGAVLDRLLERARASVALREWRASHRPSPGYPPELPITARKDDIVAAIRAHPVVVVAGETGSGKTTQLPKFCLEAGLGVEAKIGCTQPRRVAALSVARRIASELDVEFGREVGCKIRFDDRSSPETFVKLMTDGMLLAEVQGDPLLVEYNVIVLDEAHERSLNIDFLLGHLKGLVARRDDLKLVITSATIDTAAFSSAFGNAPVIEVSGRLYPVEVIYQPMDAAEEERGDVTYVDAAVRATELIVRSGDPGDVLIFMPGERDIRETSDVLEARLQTDAEVIPLYGRLSAGDQLQVFAPAKRRRVIVATNIAETSITLPGIRFVVDSGFARMNRYSPRTRTRRLPIEPISRSSANQRKGRAGRVQDGVCIRLYSREDFEGRPEFTQPEIQRSNLAEVILRMKAFHLGAIETFPFLDPPSPAAIQDGYNLLNELGALDNERELTPLGHDLARLPIDPTLGRMVLQSQREHATRELLIIASGLSIQDPRERPLEQQAAADTAHRRYSHPTSDFLTLLNVWAAVHDQWEALRTQNQRRKFCRANFLSYQRMREWQDLHAQLCEALQDRSSVGLNESNADYGAIHRSILAGLLSQVAHREERNQYRGTGERRFSIFPGSVLFERGEKSRPVPASAQPQNRKPPKSRQPAWIVAGEIVETSQVFGRGVAGIESEWIAELGAHLCKVKHNGPRWNTRAGKVLVDEVVTLQGLEVSRRKVAYGLIAPRDATAIFIRSALVEEHLLLVGAEGGDPMDADAQRPSGRPPSLSGTRPLPARYRFLEGNRRLCEKVENYQTRVRRHDVGDMDEALFNFYAQRIDSVASVEELDRLLGERGGPGFLCASEADLTGTAEIPIDATMFPDSVSLSGQPVSVTYAYAPGQAWDGVTLRLPPELAQQLPASMIQWAVPNLRSDAIRELLTSLPKAIRRQLQPFPPKIAEIVGELEPRASDLLLDLSRFVRERYGVEVPVSTWRAESLPAHLRPRLEVIGGEGEVLVAGRDLGEIRKAIAELKPKPTRPSPAWSRAVEAWERDACEGWNFGDLPERIVVEEIHGMPVFAWPGLVVEEGMVGVRLFRVQESAGESSLAGVQRMVELALSKDFAWLERDLRRLSRFAALYASLGPVTELLESAFHHLRRHVLPSQPLSALKETEFRAAIEQSQRRIPGLVQGLTDRLGPILELRAEIERRMGSSAAKPDASAPTPSRTIKSFASLASAVQPPKAPHPLAGELAMMVPPRFLDHIAFDRLPHLPRYLKALLLRMDRAKTNPLRDQERVGQLAPYVEALRQLRRTREPSKESLEAIEEFRWMIEEFKVSLFAQELGTAAPISAKRLDEFLEKIRHSAGPGAS